MNKFGIGDKVFHSKLTGRLTVVAAWIQPASNVPGATWAAFACYRLLDQHGEEFTTGEESCMTAAPVLYRIRLQLENVNKLVDNGVRFVCDDRRSWDGGWFTSRAAEAKTWKTERGAQRWLTERPAVKGTVELA